jgi:hypothetical protein
VYWIVALVEMGPNPRGSDADEVSLIVLPQGEVMMLYSGIYNEVSL